MTTSGAAPIVISQFVSSTSYGGLPRGGLFVVDSNHLVGTAPTGGLYSKGVVYLLTRSRGSYSYNAIYHFGTVTNDGSAPWGTLIADPSGNLYGTTQIGGASRNGTVFKCTASANYTYNCATIYSFAGGSDGANPVAALAIDNSGNLYGTTQSGGAYGYGTIFELTP